METVRPISSLVAPFTSEWETAPSNLVITWESTDRPWSGTSMWDGKLDVVGLSYVALGKGDGTFQPSKGYNVGKAIHPLAWLSLM